MAPRLEQPHDPYQSFFVDEIKTHRLPPPHLARQSWESGLRVPGMGGCSASARCPSGVSRWAGGCPLSLWLQLGNAVRYPNVPAAAQGRAHFPAPFDLSGHLIDLTQVCYTVRDKSFIITQSAFYGTFQRQTKTESPVHTQLIMELYRLSAHRRGPPNPHTMG